MLAIIDNSLAIGTEQKKRVSHTSACSLFYYLFFIPPPNTPSDPLVPLLVFGSYILE